MLFTRLEEKTLVDHIVYMARVGYGYTITDCQHIAYDYAVSIGKEVRAKEKVSQGWIYAFLGRWKEELKVVKPQKLTLARAQCNQGNIDNYFKDLNKILDDHHLKTAPKRIYNVDESGFSTEHSPLKIVCGSNLKASPSHRQDPRQLLSSEEEMLWATSYHLTMCFQA